jgi:hypothetical protein
MTFRLSRVRALGKSVLHRRLTARVFAAADHERRLGECTLTSLIQPEYHAFFDSAFVVSSEGGRGPFFISIRVFL